MEAEVGAPVVVVAVAVGSRTVTTFRVPLCMVIFVVQRKSGVCSYWYSPWRFGWAYELTVRRILVRLHLLPAGS